MSVSVDSDGVAKGIDVDGEEATRKVESAEKIISNAEPGEHGMKEEGIDELDVEKQVTVSVSARQSGVVNAATPGYNILVSLPLKAW